MRKILLLVVCLSFLNCGVGVKKHEINLDKTLGGIYEIPVTLNDKIDCKFILDTGCAETLISNHLFLFLVANGLVNQDDMLPSRDFMLGNGTIITCERFILRKMVIGGVVLRDVSVCIGVNGSPLLLGQNVLGRFNFVEIDYRKDLIILKE